MNKTLLEVKGLKKHFASKKGWFQQAEYVQAVNGINLTVREGETLSIVGESGCGKSTTGRCLLRLLEPTSGEIWYRGKDLTKLTGKEMRAMRRQLQMVFQDPFATLNPKLTIRRILEEPLVAQQVSKEKRAGLIEETIRIVGLTPSHLDRYPHQFSGGQRQRIGIARALMLRPDLIVADEPVSALDVSIQSQILNLLQDLQEQFGMTYIFISHDLGVVEHISDRVAVMYLGEIVELSDKEELFQNPLHPYTRALISAIPVSDPDEKKERIILQGDLPSPANPPTGCRFHPRCQSCMDICKTDIPEETRVNGQMVKCHLYS
ncbi:dipeptide ABC transporter ATP-binding protein [Brevibacillus choshinensis]|uniref:ABC transporter ATP-binding protein n=1 Tax=Brevibacillus choshinensis TaxID=54911 RepID=UPI002E1EB258|nr:dipeptide ABC transporter ATP-binding protein [Brevibacillus choshinensis]MED4784211.1 dipeptide ABC transporter ATP-binding protein [Brevibacillus choshinensis]